MSHVRFIGLDVHAETMAVAEPDGEVRSLGVIPNRSESIRKLMKKQGPADQLRVCDEAGPTGSAPARAISREFLLFVPIFSPGIPSASTPVTSLKWRSSSPTVIADRRRHLLDAPCLIGQQ